MPQALDGVPGGRLHGLADPVGDRVEPFRDHARELRLPAPQGFAQHVNAARGVGLNPGKLAHACFDLLGTGVLACGLDAARAGSADDQQRRSDQGRQEEGRPNQRCNEAAVQRVDGEQIHAALLA